MRIGIEAQRLFRPKKHGMDIVALELIKALHELDRENEYHLFVKADADLACLELKHPNFTLHVLPSLPYPIWEQVYLPFYVRKLKLDVLHCTANTAPLIAPCTTIVTLHDIIFLESNPLNKGTWYQKFGNLYRRWLVPAVVRTSDLLMTVSAYEQKRIMQHFALGEDKVKVVYNGVGPHFFHKHTPDELVVVKGKYRLPERFILFLGNENPKKNLPNVIRAYSKYVDQFPNGLDLVVLDFPKASLERFVEKEGLNKSIVDKTFSPGYINNKELPAVIQASQLFLYPSLRESFGIPILEAMACSVAVISSNTSSMPEVAGDAALLVNPESVSEIAEALVRLLGDEELGKSLIKKGLERSLSFSWTASAKKSLAIYRSFLA
jgi:glycosyltransferase involved in cell wall biosynthesis